MTRPNALQRYIAQGEWSEREAMNLLQGDGGPISDLCENACDVPDSDGERAVWWLKIKAAKRAALKA